MLEYNDVTPGKVILMDGAPYEVLNSHVFRKQQRKPVNQTKLRNLITGKVVDTSFHHTDKLEEAEIKTREIKYLYTNRGEYWFCEIDTPSERFNLAAELLGTQTSFLKVNSVVEAREFDEKIIGIKIPIKMELKVTEAAPAVRGNTVQGGSKIVVLETGATLQVPMFINEGDILRVNTQTGEYVERVDKA
ncbi:MAG TPA: elongation factor P [Candidatus Paceibacterota bacterium]